MLLNKTQYMLLRKAVTGPRMQKECLAKRPPCPAVLITKPQFQHFQPARNQMLHLMCSISPLDQISCPDLSPLSLTFHAPGTFERGKVDTFQLHVQDLGVLKELLVGHDGTGLTPAWHLLQLEVTEVAASKV